MITSGNVVDEYRKSHAGSENLHNRAVEFFAGNGATHSVRILEPFRPYITRALGSKKWDVDGNEYIDYVTGHGALILGHSHPLIVQALQEQAARGVHYGENHELEVVWAELIMSMMPWMEKVEFFACGNEANMMAVRLARLFTGRKKVLRFEEHFHGWADQLSPPGTPGTLPEHNVINTTIIPANEPDILETELAKKEYAILFTEGGGAHLAGQVPLDNDFVRVIPELTRKYGTIWLIDEVVTGFRDSPGGWQATMGVQPDLASLGKCVSGGLSAGALVGRGDILEAFNSKTPAEKRIRHSGTWNGNPLTAAAGVAACKLLKTGEPQKKAAEAASWLRNVGNIALKERGINSRLYGRSIIHIYFGPLDYEPSNDTLPPTNDIKKLVNPALMSMREQLSLRMLQRGIATLVARAFVLSMSHSKEDIDQTVSVFIDSLNAMIAEGTFKSS